jgi:hypothetical protein
VAHRALRRSLDKLMLEILVDALADLVGESIPRLTHDLGVSCQLVAGRRVQRFSGGTGTELRGLPGTSRLFVQSIEIMQSRQKDLCGLRHRFSSRRSLLQDLLEELAGLLSQFLIQLRSLFVDGFLMIRQRTSGRRKAAQPSLDLLPERRHCGVFLVLERSQLGDLRLETLNLSP